jgi:hypothetical protein
MVLQVRMCCNSMSPYMIQLAIQRFRFTIEKGLCQILTLFVRVVRRVRRFLVSAFESELQ